jgi:diketogulonate reductase-like aldo/keto reductase
MNRREFMRDASALGAVLTLSGAVVAEPVPVKKMATRPIPGTGEPLPLVGLGNSQVFRDGDYEASRQLLDILVENGGSFIDSWSSNQKVLGRYMHEHDAKHKLFLATNVGADNVEDSNAAIRYAKEMQGKAVLDLLQLPNPGNFKKQWRLMRDAKEAGHARYIGLAIARSRYYEMVEDLLQSGTADFIQVNYSILETHTGDRLLPLARDKGVAVVTNRPFVNGQYFPLVKDQELPDWAADFDCDSWAQFSLKFILANPAVNCVITETSKPHHATDNLSAGFGRLPDEKTRSRMQELIRGFLAAAKETPELRRG